MFYKNCRRGKAESGDIDTLITHPTYTSTDHEKKHKTQLLKDVVRALENCGLITETISLGETKFMASICKIINGAFYLCYFVFRVLVNGKKAHQRDDWTLD